MRPEDIGWKAIARRFACDRTTAWRRWQKALQTVAEGLKETLPNFAETPTIMP
jgi:hypothetical protein